MATFITSYAKEKILIEPQWNVDKYLDNNTISQKQILIEPQWNVDYLKLYIYYNACVNFNRTIVECRFHYL